ncbi:MAG: prolipoprotein diacylglyceryl transferase [bacterium]
MVRTMPMYSWIYYHNLDPFIIQFTERFGIRWYGMAYVVAFFIALFMVRWQIKRGWCDLPLEKSEDYLLTLALWGVVGGRIGYVFMYAMPRFLDNPLYLVKIWQGGMSIHGGLLASAIGVYWFSWKHELSFWDLTDASSLASPPGLFFGRIANFINGELWGRPTNGDWGVVFPRADYIYEGPPIPRHPSQLYEAFLEGIVLLVILWFVRKWSETPGLTTVFFAGGYAVLRFIAEFFRAPDPHLGYEWLGLTRGHWYSVGLFLLAIVLYYFINQYRGSRLSRP